MAVERLRYDAKQRPIEHRLPSTPSLPSGVTVAMTYSPFGIRTNRTWVYEGPHGERVAMSGAPETVETDGQDRTIRTTRTVNGSAEPNETTAVTYDAAGAIITEDLQNGRVIRTFITDSLGRLRRASDPDTGVRLWTWDDTGRLLASENGVGDRIEYDYDSAGRLTSHIFLFYVLSFFLGSFVSSLFIEIMTRTNERYIYFIPTIIECFILFTIAGCGQNLIAESPNLIAFTLLFAMGLQNALVTRISDAIVRTTHLTGLFTDLGIELSQLFFYKANEQRDKLTSTISLRMRIIAFFFIGGIVGGILYAYLGLHVLILPASLLLIGLFYDSMKFKLLYWKRKHEMKEKSTI